MSLLVYKEMKNCQPQTASLALEESTTIYITYKENMHSYIKISAISPRQHSLLSPNDVSA